MRAAGGRQPTRAGSTSQADDRRLGTDEARDRDPYGIRGRAVPLDEAEDRTLQRRAVEGDAGGDALDRARAASVGDHEELRATQVEAEGHGASPA